MMIRVDLYAQVLVEDPGTTQVGPKAAENYFIKRKEKEAPRAVASDGGGDRFMSLHVGTFMNDKAYRWGTKKRAEDVGKGFLGVTYRVGEWKSSMDLFFRAELMSYDVDTEDPVKLSVMPIIAFPDVRSSFPVYFGAGLGAGVFFKQAGSESDLSLDYALIVGGRFQGLFDSSAGLFIESGLKGHILLLSSGQQDGVYLSAGGIFEF